VPRAVGFKEEEGGVSAQGLGQACHRGMGGRGWLAGGGVLRPAVEGGRAAREDGVSDTRKKW
jgi:hypothetical protein